MATRLRGAEAVVDLFCDPTTDPQLARLLVSNYNSHLRPDIGDVRFLVCALQHYIDRGLPWLTKLRADMWDNGVFLMLNGLSNEHAVRLLRRQPVGAVDAARAAADISANTPIDDDILEESRSLGAALSD